jgi:hypothetical protein
MNRNRAVTGAISLAAAIVIAGPATAAGQGPTVPPLALPPPPAARFAIIVGVNQSVDADARPLRYADDDAAAYLELFRALGARTYLLSRFDEGTRRLHPQAVAEALDPRRQELDRLVEQVSADVALARRRGVSTIVYFVYAGHGSVENGRGYLALEDARLYGADLEQLIVDRVGGAETHFIVDACYSVFLAMSRGPGGERHEAYGFSTLGGLAARPGVGLLLSTSSARESHEWSEFQAGVFSHEVRSGLLGAADVDGDGQVTYREIAAFVERANSPIPNERFRPDVYAKEPASARTLLDLRMGLARRLELDGEHPGHYFIEDARGVRLADFNNARGQPLRVMRPAGDGPLYLRKLGEQAGGDLEYVMDAAPSVLRLEDLHAQPSTTAPRGAAQESFRLLFSLPFSQQVVDAFVERRPTVVAAPSIADMPSVRSRRRPIAFGLLAVGAAAAAGGTWALLSAFDAQRRMESSQAGVYQANQLIDQRNDWARALYGISGTALATGTLLLLWPRLTGAAAPPVRVGISHGGDGGTVLEWAGRF